MNGFVLCAGAVVLGLVLITSVAFGRGGRGGHCHHGQSVSAACPLAVPAPAEDPSSQAAPAAWLTCRYLRIKNDTGKKLTLFLQYRTWTDKQRYVWYPADPATGDKVLTFEIEPGAETDLDHEGWRINASRVRLWAVAESGEEWLDNQEKDLWLVEADDQGQHYYYADALETFTFTFKE